MNRSHCCSPDLSVKKYIGLNPTRVAGGFVGNPYSAPFFYSEHWPSFRQDPIDAPRYGGNASTLKHRHTQGG